VNLNFQLTSLAVSLRLHRTRPSLLWAALFTTSPAAHKSFTLRAFRYYRSPKYCTLKKVCGIKKSSESQSGFLINQLFAPKFSNEIIVAIS
jgi:hypothetical protein